MKIDSPRIRVTWQGLVGITCLVGLLFASNCPADDWPHWMGPGMDGVWHETGTIDQFPEAGATVLWRQNIGSGYAGPSVVGDQLFIMDRTTVARGRDVVWSHPAFADGKMFARNDQEIICVELKKKSSHP